MKIYTRSRVKIMYYCFVVNRVHTWKSFFQKLAEFISCDILLLIHISHEINSALLYYYFASLMTTPRIWYRQKVSLYRRVREWLTYAVIINREYNFQCRERVQRKRWSWEIWSFPGKGRRTMALNYTFKYDKIIIFVFLRWRGFSNSQTTTQ